MSVRRIIALSVSVMLLGVVTIGLLASAQADTPDPVTVVGLVDQRGQSRLDKVVEVDMAYFLFEPANLEVEVGTTVVWINKDPDMHNARVISKDGVALDGDYKADMIRRNQRWAITFNHPGVYHYICDPHVGFGMEGYVTVK